MLVNPGEQAVLRWKATRAGVFLYHCAPGGSMTVLHVISGMSGAVMVLPREGLRVKTGKLLHYDRIYRGYGTGRRREFGTRGIFQRNLARI